MKWYAGTSGYSYKEWKNTFYPADLKSEDWLAFYASQLPAVEINNTFYRMPRAHVVEGWAAAVPDTFRFVLKASRRITHQARLKDVEESLDYLVKRVCLLEDKLGLHQSEWHQRRCSVKKNPTSLTKYILNTLIY